jgi:hypothetical protein
MKALSALFIFSVALVGQSPNPLQVRGFSIQITNDTGTGTALYQLAKVNSSGNAVTTGTSDTLIPVFIVAYGAGVTGLATLGVGGIFPCLFDAGGVSIGHFVIQSTATGGRCMDGGATAPSSGWVIGIAQTAAGGSANAEVISMLGYNGSSSNPKSCTLTAATSCTITGAVIGASITLQDSSGNLVFPSSVTGLNTTSPTCHTDANFTGTCWAR